MTRLPYPTHLSLPFLAALSLAAPPDTEVLVRKGADLAAVYAGTLDHEAGVGAADWSVGPDDVWELKRFDFEFKGKLEFSCDSATLVVGKNESKANGKSAVWAVLIPDEAAPITSSEVGHGDRAVAVFMRFHPSRIGDLFPKGTVKKQGDPMALIEAKRIYSHKINAGWQWDNMPVVPTRASMIIDLDTTEGKRRFYSTDSDKATVRYVDAFVNNPVPLADTTPVTTKDAARVFEEAWSAFDAEYAMFGVKPDVDWKKLKKQYLPLAKGAQTQGQLAGVIGLLVSHLEDLHVWVRHGETWIPTYNRFRVTNADWRTVKPQLKGLEERKGLAFGRLEEDLGYIVIWNLSTQGLSDTFDEALEGLADTTGLVVDLRWNGGGDEILGRRLAGRFLDKEAVYSKSQYRTGKRHKDLGKAHERTFEPRGPWRYEAPVALLQGEKTMSSAESLALMFAQCPKVTTIGHHTAGSSANPRRLELDFGITVNLPRWLDLDPSGQPIDRVGVAPDVPIDAPNPGDFQGADPVFEAAIQHLTAIEDRGPGKRD